jgi:phenylpropionate dioxygenase-like ring-hydroxylating dioxygenase large terminal subunit
VFINNWYAVCIASELTQVPLKVRVLDCDFVLFRDRAGVAHCLSDVCCHRGASLSAGKRRDDLLICPQHGWEFEGSGKCVRVPAGIKDPAAPPRKARVPSYPVEEHYGLVFAFLGDLDESHRPTLRNILPEYDDPDGWHVGILSRQKDVNYVRMAENYNDPCHVHYVHEFARWLPKGVTIETLELTDTYVKAFHAAWDARGATSRDRGLMMEFDVVGMVSRNTNRQPGYPPTVVVATVTPIDEGNTQIFMLLLQPKPGTDGRGGLSAADHQMLVTMTRDQVMDEDYAVLKGTRPRQAASPTEELLVETDVTLAQVRKMTRDYAAKYGEVDAQALAALRDTHIRVVPCPGHRTEPGQWVHKTVPLVPAARELAQDMTKDRSRVA